ncbi:MAG: anti-phage dCTP deaminase [Janthinobacterium lividum]
MINLGACTKEEAANRPELIIGLVSPSGTRLDDLSQRLANELKSFGYQTIDIRLSDLLVNFSDWKESDGTEYFQKIKHLQEMGNAFRRKLEDKSALARAGIAAIRAERGHQSGNPDLPVQACAYIIRQLKHPAEVDLLHQVYGSSFLLIAGHAPRELRATLLADKMAREDRKPGEGNRYKSHAYEIITTDEKEDDEYGQHTTDTYPKADFFANLGENSGEHQVGRLVELVFGHPFHTPSPEESAMYQAHAVSLKSADENRQVGAAIVHLHVVDKKIRNADVIAVGMNEVPRRGGGFYFMDSPDPRDQWLAAYAKEDRAKEIKVSALTELIAKIQTKNWLVTDIAEQDASNLAERLLPDLKGTQFMNIGEFSRPVHAEMAALIDSARRGVSVNGHTMFVTTFPCHNCAKHIIAAGLRKVVYLEPYAKSRAHNLYKEEIDVDPTPTQSNETGDDKVVFCAFSGIGPRQYQKFFSMSERGAHKGNSLSQWDADRRCLFPRYISRNASLAYLQAEYQELSKLPPDLYKWDVQFICPDNPPQHVSLIPTDS